MPDGQDQQVAKILLEDLKAQAKGVAELRGMAPGARKTTPDEEMALFWKQADGWTPDKEMALLAEGKSREAVGLLKYPEREKLAKSGGRALSKYEQAKWFDTMARKADPAWAPPPNKAQEPPFPPDAPPPPEDATAAAPAALPPAAGPYSLEGY